MKPKVNKTDVPYGMSIKEENRVRLPRKMKKRMIGTGSTKILKCYLNISINGGKYVFWLQTKES